MNSNSPSLEQKWPMMDKATSSWQLIKISPTRGKEGSVITVILEALAPYIVAKIAFNSLMVDTKQVRSQQVTTLIAHVPPFQHTHSPTISSVPISICFLDKDMVTDTFHIARFEYFFEQNIQQQEFMLKSDDNDFLNSSDNNAYYPYTFDQLTTYQPSYYDIPMKNSNIQQQEQQEEQAGYFINNNRIGLKSISHIPPTSVANYQPYPGLVSRIQLEIDGNLDLMSKSWTKKEWDTNRRLIQFYPEQFNNNTIKCHFQIIDTTPSNTKPRTIVSCIYWKERNDFFITSVDCIYLLESLMSTKFNVEEKNRIRRNLEGFRPLTVSKCKEESAEFFKLIMSFPNPKPRNIEKDLKVFPWKALPYALKKIITKYTATPFKKQ